jgi:hypothetical protein
MDSTTRVPNGSSQCLEAPGAGLPSCRPPLINGRPFAAQLHFSNNTPIFHAPPGPDKGTEGKGFSGKLKKKGTGR